jgi:hypothetical protein
VVAAVGLWIALGLAVPASTRPAKPINLNLPASTAQAQAPKTLAPNFWTAPIPKPPPPKWVRALFGDPDHPPPGRARSGHGGARGPGFAGGRGHACHGGGGHR